MKTIRLEERILELLKTPKSTIELRDEINKKGKHGTHMSSLVNTLGRLNREGKIEKIGKAKSNERCKYRTHKVIVWKLKEV